MAVQLDEIVFLLNCSEAGLRLLHAIERNEKLLLERLGIFRYFRSLIATVAKGGNNGKAAGLDGGVAFVLFVFIAVHVCFKKRNEKEAYCTIMNVDFICNHYSRTGGKSVVYGCLGRDNYLDLLIGAETV